MPSTPPAGPGDELRSRLLDAAAEVFAERGYEGAGVHEIARRAGLTTGAIYGRFSGKTELLLEALEARVPDEVRRLLAGEVDDPPTDIIAHLGSHLIDESHGEGGLLLEAIVASRREPALGERLKRRLEDDDAQLAKLIEEAKGAGLTDPELATEAITTFCHAVSFGMVVQHALGRPLPEPDSWDALITRLISSLVPPPDPGAAS